MVGRIKYGRVLKEGGARLDTDQLDTTNHSDRCLEAFHCSSAVSGSCSIDSCPNGGHPLKDSRGIREWGYEEEIRRVKGMDEGERRGNENDN